MATQKWWVSKYNFKLWILLYLLIARGIDLGGHNLACRYTLAPCWVPCKFWQSGNFNQHFNCPIFKCWISKKRLKWEKLSSIWIVSREITPFDIRDQCFCMQIPIALKCCILKNVRSCPKVLNQQKIVSQSGAHSAQDILARYWPPICYCSYRCSMAWRCWAQHIFGPLPTQKCWVSKNCFNVCRGIGSTGIVTRHYFSSVRCSVTWRYWMQYILVPCQLKSAESAPLASKFGGQSSQE